MFTEQALNTIKQCLDASPEVERYEIIEDGTEEVWVYLKKDIRVVGMYQLVTALKCADTFQIDFTTHEVRLYFCNTADYVQHFCND